MYSGTNVSSKKSEIKRPPNDALMFYKGSSCQWSYGSWIYNYICNQCLLPLMLWIRISIRARCTRLCVKACQWLATGRWFSPGTPVSSTNKTDRHDIIQILLKVALNTIKQTNWCSIRFVMHVYMVVTLLLLTMPTLYEIIMWWIFVVHVWQIVNLRLHVESVVSFSPFLSFKSYPTFQLVFFPNQLSHGYSSGYPNKWFTLV
jgi:hypothetical protein